jgi:putative flippase GtrA
VAAVYLGLPVLLDGAVGVPIQIAIPIAYIAAVCLHFNLQRHFVFRHVDQFALTTRAQITRYVVVGAVQYPVTALLTWALPRTLGFSPRAAFVCTALAITATFYIILRTHIFHAGEVS